MLFVPRGFAHGFLTLEDDTEFLYKCDDIYDGGYEGGVIWDDMSLSIPWDEIMRTYEIASLEISKKDQENPPFSQYFHTPIF